VKKVVATRTVAVKPTSRSVAKKRASPLVFLRKN